jgi:predicted molibdopterin-dependent oxidoreductase YjgC
MKLTIDDREILVEGAPTLLETARCAGIPIPSLCDHPDLEPFAGCRLCLVEISGRNDFAPACATPAAEGMVVRTRTPELVSLRKKILELILAEHPHACLVCAEKTTCDDLKSTIRKVGEVTGCVLCPVNGDCELQEVVEAVGMDKVDLPAIYRDFEVRREDPFFDRDYNLCILCGRCIRVCEEVRGASVLAFIHRGDRTSVGTAFDRPLLDSGCRFCGACVDVCPTGALVERAVRPRPRAERSAGIVCPYCAQGCGLELGVREGRVLYSKPSPTALPNHGQACVKGRFLVRDAFGGPGRILEAHVRRDSRLEPAAFDEALERAAAGLLEAGEERRALIYPSQVSLEDAFLFLEFGRTVMNRAAVATAAPGSIWSALEALAEARGVGLPPNRELSEIEECGSILAWDIDLPVDHPIAWLKVVKAIRRGARLVAAGTASARLSQAAAALDVRTGSEVATGAALAAALLRAGVAPSVDDGFEDLKKSCPGGTAVSGSAARALRTAAEILASNKPAAILFDADAARGPSGPDTLAWLWNIALLLGARLFPLGRGGNERGVHELELAFGFPASGKGWEAIRAGLEKRAFQALYLAGPAPDLEDRKPPFLVCQDTHWSRNAEAADVVLPAAAFAESGGTWVNTEGRIRTYPPAVLYPGAARPDGEILAALARKMGHPGFGRPDAAAVLREIRTQVPTLAHYEPAGGGEKEFFVREGPPRKPRFVAVSPSSGSPKPLAGRGILLKVRYSGDGLRGYDPLAKSRGCAKVRKPGQVFIAPADAARLGIMDGDALELSSGPGALAAIAGLEPAVALGTAETAVRGSSLTERDWLDRGLVPVEVGRKR